MAEIIGKHGVESSTTIAEVNERYGNWVRAYTVVHPNKPADGHAYRAYGIDTATLILIRPDGSIGLITQQLAIKSVADYLGQAAMLSAS